MIADLIRQNRSCRRFYEDHPVEIETLRELVDLARLSASGGNLQPLKYILSSNSEKNDQIFHCVAWAAYFKDWPGPAKGERPAAYIIILGDTRIRKDFGCEHGIAAQSILLGAREKGLAGCMMSPVDRERLRQLFQIPPELKLLFVLPIGKPKEKAVIDTVGPDGNIQYWRDKQGVQHVPKRSLDELIFRSDPPHPN